MAEKRKRKPNRYERIREDFTDLYEVIERMDRRLALPKEYHRRRMALYEHLGGKENVSAVEELVIKGCIFNAMMAESFRAVILKLVVKGDGSPELPRTLIKQYQTFQELLNKDVTNLGLKPRQLEKALDLQTYLQNKEGEGTEGG